MSQKKHSAKFRHLLSQIISKMPHSYIFPTIKTRYSGFTLIELVIVIIILGILSTLALPKFINLQDDAYISQVKSTAGAFKSAINSARAVYMVRYGSGEAEDVKVYQTNAAIDAAHPYEQPGNLDFNQYGWPVQNYMYRDSTRVQLDNVDDCISLWRTILTDHGPSITKNTKEDSEYVATYLGNGNQAKDMREQLCKYHLAKRPDLYFTYNAKTGQVNTHIPA